MKKLCCFILLSMFYLQLLMAQTFYKTPLANTYSIVAYDELTGEMGVAVQSHWFSVGTIVTWGEAGVGVIATQSFANPAFGPDGLALLKKGLTAQETVDELIKNDEGRDVRQLAIVDAKGNTAAYTGKNCLADAGQIVGEHHSVQANMMANDKIWAAMDKSYKNSDGELVDRLMIALEAAENAGGDVRGKQSAAILVVNAKPTGKLWIDRKVDLRIEDHPTPIKEMKRLIQVHKAYSHMNQGDVDLEHKDFESALENYSKAEQLYTENVEMSFWTGVTLAGNGKLEEALPYFKKAFDKSENWRILLDRIYPQLLDISKEKFEKIKGLE